MGPLATTYAAIQHRVVGLLTDLDDADAELRVPATPVWTVHDLVAHVSGVVDDAVNGRMAGAPSEAWTAAQVERSRTTSIAELVARWNDQLTGFLSALDGSGRWPAAFDLLTHEHDLCHALGRAGHRHGGELATLARMIAAGVDADVAIDTESGRLRGADDAAVRLATTDFELFRSRFGRRTRAEVAAYSWSGDPADVGAVIDRWFIFGPATRELGE